MKKSMLMSLFDQTERAPLSVSELTAQLKDAVEGQFPSVWVEGEISNFMAASSGHWYFSLKDESAQLRVTCFRNSNIRMRFRPENGMQVSARGRLTVYEKRGDYQLSAEALEPVGAGALQIAFEQLKAKLNSEGLFAQDVKRPLPLLPRRVGVITSRTGAAIRDIINVISRRTRTVDILVAPVRVQGAGSAAEMIAALQRFNQYNDHLLRTGRTSDVIDVIIIGRGGGSVEDLWAFNDEALARAIRASSIPVISAVGHETDFSISDFVADLRAATPSAAAELVAAHEVEVTERVERLSYNLVRNQRGLLRDARALLHQYSVENAQLRLQTRMQAAMQDVDRTLRRMETAIAAKLRLARTRTDAASFLLTPKGLRTRVGESRNTLHALLDQRKVAMDRRLARAKERFAVAAASLDALSPLAVLARGYALAQDEAGKVLRDVAALSPGDSIRVRLQRGALDCTINRTHNS